MKKLSFILLLIVAACTVHGQSKRVKSTLEDIQDQWEVDESNNILFQRVIEIRGISKEALYKRVEKFFIYNYAGGKDAIQLSDKDQGTIIGKGFWSRFYEVGLFNYSAGHILRVDVKDGKARLSLTVQNYEVAPYSKNEHDKDISIIPVRDVFPVNRQSKSKTMEGKVFCQLHLICMDLFEQAENALKKDGPGIEKDKNW